MRLAFAATVLFAVALGGWWDLAPVLVGLAYAGSCWWMPYAPCWCCKRAGTHSRKDGKAFRLCRICTGTGRRLRLGRRLWNAARRRRLGTS